MVIKDKPIKSPEEEIRDLKNHLKENWNRAEKFKAHRDSYAIAAIIVPFLMLIWSNLSGKYIVLDFWIAVLFWFLMLSVSAFIGLALEKLRDIK